MAYRKTPQLSDAELGGMVISLVAQKKRVDLERKLFNNALKDAMGRGITSRELGKLLNMSPSTVARWARDAA